jgi:hypothetical protein
MQQLELEKYTTLLSELKQEELKLNMRVYTPNMRCHGQIVGIDRHVVHIVWGMRYYHTGSYGIQCPMGTRGYTKARWYNLDHVFLAE